MTIPPLLGDLARLALRLAEGGAVQHPQPAIARTACAAVAAMMAGCCAVAAVACSLAALWIFAVPYVGPSGAPLVVACALLVMSFGLLLVARYGLKPRPVPVSSEAPSTVLLLEATQMLKDHKVSVLISAVLAGLVAGRGDR